MKNLIKKILKEELSSQESSSFGDFYSLFKKTYKDVVNIDLIFESLVNDIKKSPTPKITIVDRGSFCGLSLNDNLLLNKYIFSRGIYEFIFILFHEIAHQYQYKKHGKDILYKLTTEEITENNLDYLIDIEMVADRFGELMAKKYSDTFNLKKTNLFSPYKNRGGKENYRRLIEEMQKRVKDGTITCVEEMESFLVDYLTKSVSYPTYTYSGSSFYPHYGYKYQKTNNYSQYSKPNTHKDSYYDDFSYEKEFSKYENGDKSLEEKFTPLLNDLKNEIADLIQDVIVEVSESYGDSGLEVLVDILDESEFKDFYYGVEIKNSDSFLDDGDYLNLRDLVEGFIQYQMRNIKEFIEDRLSEILDEIENSYGWEGEHMFIELLDKEGFGDLWSNY